MKSTKNKQHINTRGGGMNKNETLFLCQTLSLHQFTQRINTVRACQPVLASQTTHTAATA